VENMAAEQPVHMTLSPRPLALSMPRPLFAGLNGEAQGRIGVAPSVYVYSLYCSSL